MERFNAAFQQHNPSLLKDIIAPDCRMESIQGPLGVMYTGYDACLAFWTELATNTETHFDLEEVIVNDNRAIIKWCYHWGEGEHACVRGVNLMRAENGKIIEALGYAKTIPATGLDD